MEFKNHADEIVKAELAAALKQQNVVIERDFKRLIHERHGFSMPTIAGALRRMHPKMGLTRRHLTDELKNFHSLDMPGYPVVYVSK